ncbi:MAG: glycolate oxidase subunit GlcE [gamma proteobacterium symbiont of Phacoides pectinatus]
MADISKQLTERVETAYREEMPLNIIGDGSKPFIGRAAEGAPFDVAEHSGIVSYKPTELVITARCGTSMEEILAELAEHGQICPFEPPLMSGSSTLGGILACNLSGPARPWLGSIRDAVLGVHLINGKGEYLRFGGQVIKNVAGYDVSRLQAGALGTLGVITEVSFKVLPKPVASATAMLEMDAATAIKQMNQLAGQPTPISGAAWWDGRLYLRFQGASRAVAEAVKQQGGESVAEADPLWEGLTEQTIDYFQGDAPLWRFSLNANADHFFADQPWLIDWGGNQRWLRGTFDQAELESLAQQARGHVTLFRDGDRSGEVHQTLPVVQQKILKNLKAAFDPKGILNPGRLYSWL